MKKLYLIQDVDGMGFWSHHDRKFKGYLWAEKFDDKIELLTYAREENIGVFRITEAFDTK